MEIGPNLANLLEIALVLLFGICTVYFATKD